MRTRLPVLVSLPEIYYPTSCCAPGWPMFLITAVWRMKVISRRDCLSMRFFLRHGHLVRNLLPFCAIRASLSIATLERDVGYYSKALKAVCWMWIMAPILLSRPLTVWQLKHQLV